MADWYVSPTGGSPSTGRNWGEAFQTLAAAIAAAAAGDRFIVDTTYAFSGGTTTFTFPGTVSAPNQVLSAVNTGLPFVAADLARGASLVSTGDLIIGGWAYFYGFSVACGSSSSSLNFLRIADGTSTQPMQQRWEDCDFSCLTSNANGRIDCRVDGAQQGQVELINPRLLFSATGQGLFVNADVRIEGGGRLGTTGSTPTGTGNGVFSRNQAKKIDISGFDFSGWANTVNMVKGPGNCGFMRLRNCRMPSGWAGQPFATSGALTALTFAGNAEPSGYRDEAWNCDDGDTNYSVIVHDKYGDLVSETSIVKTGGASDGTTPISWRATSHNGSNANQVAPVFPLSCFRLPEIASEFIDTPGVQKTLTIDIAHEGASDLNDDEVWVEVQYLGQLGSPQQSLPSTTVSDRKATPATDAAAQESSSATWSDGSPTFRKQKLVVSFTPSARGVAIATVCLAKSGTTIYVDPVAQLT